MVLSLSLLSERYLAIAFGPTLNGKRVALLEAHQDHELIGHIDLSVV